MAREAAHSFCSQVLEVARQAADECFQTEAAAARQRELEHLARARAGKAEAETHDAGRAVAVEASHNMGEQIRPNASSHLQAEATAADERQVKKERAAREKALAKQVSHGLGLDLINRECRGLQQLRMLNLDDGHQHRWEGKTFPSGFEFFERSPSLAMPWGLDLRPSLPLPRDAVWV